MKKKSLPKGKRRKLKWSVRLCLYMLLTILGILASDLKVRPLIQTFAAYQARAAATRAINEAVEEVLQQENILYSDLVTLRENSQGDIRAIETRVIEFNLLRAKLTRAVDNKLLAKEEQIISIPAGTLLGGSLLSGRGPRVTFKVIPAGYVHTELENVFSSAGINQTLHQIMLHISAEITAVIPGYSITTMTKLDFCVAETVIVGAVPELFAGRNGS